MNQLFSTYKNPHHWRDSLESCLPSCLISTTTDYLLQQEDIINESEQIKRILLAATLIQQLSTEYQKDQPMSLFIYNHMTRIEAYNQPPLPDNFAYIQLPRPGDYNYSQPINSMEEQEQIQLILRFCGL